MKLQSLASLSLLGRALGDQCTKDDGKCFIAADGKWEADDVPPYIACLNECCQDFNGERIIQGVTCEDLDQKHGVKCDTVMDKFGLRHIPAGTTMADLCSAYCKECKTKIPPPPPPPPPPPAKAAPAKPAPAPAAPAPPAPAMKTVADTAGPIGLIKQAFPEENKGLPEKECSGVETKFESCTGKKATCEPCAEVINCKVGPWTDWSSCMCDGLRERSRRVIQSNNECGAPCNETLVDTVSCDEVECLHKPVDCAWKATSDKEAELYNGTAPDLGWGAWSSCEIPDKAGSPPPTQKTRKRLYEPSKYGGDGCTGNTEQTEACPVDRHRAQDQDCGWSVWSDWGACTCACGGGQHTRYRHVAVAPRGRGKLCEALTKAEILPCNTQSCSDPCQPVDAQWGEWNDWGMCSKSCGEGKRFRNRTLAVEAKCGGAVPDESSVEIGDCTMPSCGSIDCEFNEWSDWSDCSCTCEGIKHRFRTVKTYGDKGGEHCIGPLKQVAECHEYTTNPDCQGGPRVDCVTEWSEWSKCSNDCGGGHRTRNNTIKQLPSNGGLQCQGKLAEIGPCNTQLCGDEPQPIACAMSEWTEWSACDKCGGQKRRNRHIIQMPKNKGPPCEDPTTGDPWPAEETAACKRQCYHGEPACCIWGPWAKVGTCQTESGKDCGPGFQKIQRTLSWGGCGATTTTTTTSGSTTTVTTCITVGMDQELFDADTLNEHESQNLVACFAAGSLVTFAVSFVVLRASRASPRARGFAPVE